MKEKELLEMREKLAMRISDLRGGYIPNLKNEYTGLGDLLGQSTVENSPFCSDQIIFAMVLSNHPLIIKLLKKNLNSPYDFDPEPLYKSQILKEMKILDMGCGRRPTFARCARRFGADVYTADKIHSKEFEYYKHYFPEKSREEEIRRHIQTDLNNPESLEFILQNSGGNFDLVTEAHLDTEGCDNGEKVALKLLKKGGVYFYASGWLSSRTIIKSD